MPPVRERWPRAEDLPRLTATVDEAKAVLTEAIENFPKELTPRLRPAQLALVRLRDDLIAAQRRPDLDGDADPVRSALCRVNVCISLVYGMAYPMGSPDREVLEQARQLLNELL